MPLIRPSCITASPHSPSRQPSSSGRNNPASSPRNVYGENPVARSTSVRSSLSVTGIGLCLCMSSSSPQGNTSFTGDPRRNRNSIAASCRLAGKAKNACSNSGGSIFSSISLASCCKDYEDAGQNMKGLRTQKRAVSFETALFKQLNQAFAASLSSRFLPILLSRTQIFPEMQTEE